ncbi:MAG: hypothetical protein KC466_20770, partial [Myxococcales bacterium]|nr:hypothetical protein [Myxococcales bacterium]
SGDLLFDVRALPHGRFGLDPAGGSLFCALGLDYFSLLEGCTVPVDTPVKTLQVAIPPRAQPGGWIRVDGAGMAAAEGAGDLWLKLELLFPTSDAEALRLAAAGKVVGRLAPRIQSTAARPERIS